MKKRLYIMTGIILFFAVTNCYAGNDTDPNIMAKEIKYTSNLTGIERMTAMQQYVCGLPDGRLITLMNKIGAERFLADVQRKNRERVHNQGTTLSHNHEKNCPPRDGRQQLYSSIRTPEQKIRLCRNIANYLINTAH